RKLGQSYCRERSIFRRFDDQRVAHCKCSSRYPSQNLQWIIPGNNRGNHPMGFAKCQCRVAFEERDRVSVDLVACTAVELAIAVCGGNIRPSLTERLSR